MDTEKPIKNKPSEIPEKSVSNLSKTRGNIVSDTKENPINVEVISFPHKFNYGLVVAIASVVVAIASVVVAAYSISQGIITREETLVRMDNNLKLSSKPQLLLTTEEKGDSSCVILWNSGPGTAYDISIETHLANNIGDVACPWVSDVLLLAMELETKNRKTIFQDFHKEIDIKLLSNHPAVLSIGISNGYKTSPLQYNSMEGVYVIIRYSDALENKYFSLWDGWSSSWKFGEKNCAIRLPKYHPQFGPPDPSFLFHILTDANEKNWQEKLRNTQVIFWLENDARFLKANGYGNIPNQLNKVYIESKDSNNHLFKINYN